MLERSGAEHPAAVLQAEEQRLALLVQQCCAAESEAAEVASCCTQLQEQLHQLQSALANVAAQKLQARWPSLHIVPNSQAQFFQYGSVAVQRHCAPWLVISP